MSTKITLLQTRIRKRTGYKKHDDKTGECSFLQAEHVPPRPTSLHVHTSGKRQKLQPLRE